MDGVKCSRIKNKGGGVKNGNKGVKFHPEAAREDRP
jgi:hypothetical protein